MQITTFILAAAYIAQAQAAALLRPRTIPIVNDDSCHDATSTLSPATRTSSILQQGPVNAPTPFPVHASPEYGHIGIQLPSTTTTTTSPTLTPSSRDPLNTPSALPLPAAKAADSLYHVNAAVAPTIAPIPAPPVYTTDPSVIVTVPSFQEAYGDEYVQTTYYSCNTFATTTHCGWHEPLIYVGGSNGKSSGAASSSHSSMGSVFVVFVIGMVVALGVL